MLFTEKEDEDLKQRILICLTLAAESQAVLEAQKKFVPGNEKQLQNFFQRVKAYQHAKGIVEASLAQQPPREFSETSAKVGLCCIAVMPLDSMIPSEELVEELGLQVEVQVKSLGTLEKDLELLTHGYQDKRWRTDENDVDELLESAKSTVGKINGADLEKHLAQMKQAELRAQARAESWVKRVPKLSEFDDGVNTLVTAIKSFAALQKASHVLRTESLLLIACTCQSGTGRNLARKELASLASGAFGISQSDVHKALIAKATSLLE
ncbi:unnamed protein product [Effrenium voratum]|uniref:Uncharacterized protein n=1 Tax=Effrenium voratum TaxID=2562239 RepID=A0AA36IQ02_9DINO|nr:unnamed protein product [Effrenium voratum]